MEGVLMALRFILVLEPVVTVTAGVLLLRLVGSKQSRSQYYFTSRVLHASP